MYTAKQSAEAFERSEGATASPQGSLPLASANLSVEVQQYIYRTAYHTHNRKQTDGLRRRYLEILESLAVRENDDFKKADDVDYVQAVREARMRVNNRLQENLRNPFYRVDPSQLYEGDEHTNKFIETCIEKYVMYSHTMATSLEDSTGATTDGASTRESSASVSKKKARRGKYGRSGRGG